MINVEALLLIPLTVSDFQVREIVILTESIRDLLASFNFLKKIQT